MVAMQFRALIRDSFREAMDKKLFWIMIGTTILVAAAMACVGLSEGQVSLLFGWRVYDVPEFSPTSPGGRAFIGALLTKGIGDFYIGFVGIIIALVATCGVIPSLMERGAIDVVVSKPISRSALFLGKYLGSMVFVFIQATIFVVLTLLVAGLRWNYWSWAYLWCIPLIVILYSYIYAFTALFGVMTRNAMAAFLLSMLAWLMMFLPQATYETLDGAGAMGFDVEPKWVQTAKLAKSIVPNTTEITYIAGNLIGASNATDVAPETPKPSDGPNTTSSPDAFTINMKEAAESERRISNVNPWTSIGSSLAFEAVIVMIAMWKFSRREF